MKLRIVLIVGLAAFLLGCNDIEDCQLDPFTPLAVVTLRPAATNSVLATWREFVIQDVGLYTARVDTLANVPFLIELDQLRNDITLQFFSASAQYFVTIGYQTQTLVYELDCPASVRFFNLQVIDTNLPESAIAIPGPDLDLRRTRRNVEITF